VSFATESTTLRAPLIASWTLSDIRWPGTPYTPPPHTGNPTSPASWIDFLVDYPGTQPLTFSALARIDGVLDIGIFIEPGPRAEPVSRDYIDALEAIYAPNAVDSSTLFFRPFEARADPVGLDTDAGGSEWWLTRWVLPFWRIE